METISPARWQTDADHWPPLLARVNAETVNGYAKFRRTLTPDFATVWRDIALGYFALCGVLVMVAQAPGFIGGIAAAVAGAVAIGFLIAFLQLFIHEAAHYNLAADRTRSDALANLLIAWQVGTTIAAYRRVHFEHHRHLGHHNDGERSYVHKLTWRFLFEMISGVHAFRVFLDRAKAPAAKGDIAPKSLAPLVRGASIHLVILIALLALGAWPAALAWIGGMAVFFPLFATLRPLLEHRPTASDERLLTGPREAVTRMFDDGFFARIFGGAGFNRHLLHHWEPQVSYTRLGDLDDYLSRTSIGMIVEARRTTYLRAFLDILAHDRGR
jgi:fatty acid desaturase